MRALLERFETGDQGTFGRMTVEGAPWYSGELPDRGNAPNVSRIPDGTYRCDWTYSPAFKRMMYLVRDVPGRSGIRIHSANLMGDKAKGLKSHLYGCIALAERRGWLEGQKAILVSRPACSQFEDALGRQSFELEIRTCSKS